jgi:multidrug transporter EmrE-like cation transporter
LFASKPFVDTPPTAWIGIIGLTVVTIFSRLFLFAGIKRLGGLQAALLGLSELIVSVLTAFVFFGEKLSATQWIGAIALVISVAMVSFEKDLTPSHISEGWIAWVYRSFEKLQISFYTLRFQPPPAPRSNPSPLLKEIEERAKKSEIGNQKIR